MSEMTAVQRIQDYVRACEKAGKQMSFTAAMAADCPTMPMIQEWFPDVPQGLKLAEAREWLAEKALAEMEEEA